MSSCVPASRPQPTGEPLLRVWHGPSDQYMAYVYGPRLPSLQSPKDGAVPTLGRAIFPGPSLEMRLESKTATSAPRIDDD